ncbi:MAG: radical SAM protein [Nannocystaceae bacterium]
MIETIYVEHDVREHPRTQAVLARYPRATVIECDRYQEVFNRRAQNFRIQKRRPGLILARKHERRVLPAPAGYGIGGERNFYFSHMYNCVYDCQYCFLQGMYQSAHYVVFVNFEDFVEDLHAEHHRGGGEATYYYSGYDADSLVFNSTTRFLEFILPAFEGHDDLWLELRTKSTAIRPLLARRAMSNVIVAFSLSPSQLARAVEHGAPPLEARLEAILRVAAAGWPVGLRFDPVIYDAQYEQLYTELFDQVFDTLPGSAVHSVSIGPLRFPRPMFEVIQRQSPTSRLLAGPLVARGNMVSYPRDLERRMHAFCRDALRRHVPEDRLFACLPAEWGA